MFRAKVAEITETRALCPVQILLSLTGFETCARIVTMCVHFITFTRNRYVASSRGFGEGGDTCKADS
jgi:hypothetical protein